MKSKKIIIFSFILVALLLSVTAISASDLNDTEIVKESENSYADFMDEMSDSDDSFNLEKDYKFNNETDGDDYSIGIPIKNNYIINGNGHSIDGNDMAPAFDISGGTVTINNLIIKNTNEGRAITVSTNLILNNVTFINCSQPNKIGNGAVDVQSAELTVNNCKFIDNNGNEGASIKGVNSKITVTNSTFSSVSKINRGQIYLTKSNLTLSNSEFLNSTSKYATAIFAESDFDNRITILKSKFKNLKADKTAGAIASKGNITLIITECEFDNVSSKNNGGAIFIDTSDVRNTEPKVNITLSRFNNCSSNFGGAILAIEGKINITYSNFTSNRGQYSGAAVYTSNSNINIANSIFISNKLSDDVSCGGACYFDLANVTLLKNTFKENNASLASTIYSYDSNMILDNNDFNNPSDITAIYAVYGKTTLKDNKNLNESLISLNNTDYFYNFESNLGSLKLVDGTYNYTEIPKKFDLRDLNWVTPVKDQGFKGSCWAFGTMAALESALLRYTNTTYSLSVNNMQNTMLTYSKYGMNGLMEGAFEYQGMAYIIDWLGVFNDTYDEYDELGKISPLRITPENIHINNAVDIPAGLNSTDIDHIKVALMKYGALTTSIEADFDTSKYFNETASAQYYTEEGSNGGGHKICVVGWDDNYPKENFIQTPNGNGAWIVKNSWGTSWGDKGYCYISYYDMSIGDGGYTAFIISNNPYTRIYQNDMGGDFDFEKEYDYYSNVFTAEEDELIAAVGTYFEGEDEDYDFTVSVNGITVYTQKGKTSFKGYETVKLDKYIKIKKGDVFNITFYGTAPVIHSLRIHPQNGKSFVSADGETWKDLANEGKVALLKAYSIKDLKITDNLIKYYGDDTPFTAKVNPGDTVIFEINGENITVKADSNGIARLESNYSPGTYLVTTVWNGTSIINYITVLNSTISLDKSITRGYNSDYDFKVQFFYQNGTPLNNTPVDISVNGVKKSFTSDAAGYVTVKFTKLTSAQKITVTNPITGEVKSAVINVLSRFSNVKDISMYYFDGSAFKVRIRGDDGNFVGKNQAVIIKLNKRTYNVKTDSNGYAILKIPKTVKPGTYKLTATYKGQTIKKTVKVKQNLKTSKKYKVKKSAKKLVIKAKLKNGKKPLKNKKLVLKIKGKKITSKTNKKGVVKFTIKKNVIKKLKVGKKYSIKISYFKNTVKSSLKVKR